jgi:long-chain acyl-CoA synthetase
VLVAAGANSSVEHWVWVTLQSYQSIFKRLGYQFKLWHDGRSSDGRDDRHTNAAPAAEHVTLAQLLAHAPAKPPTLEPSPNAIAVMQPTSGTTGVLKLAQLSHRNLLANATQVSTLMQGRIGQERVLAVLPMFHVYGLMLGLVAAVFDAATMVLVARFNANETVELLRRHKPTVFPIVPAICEALSNELEREGQKAEGRGQNQDPGSSALCPHPSALTGLRLCISGAAPLTQAVAERFERLTGARVIEGYGLSECSPVTHANLPGRARYGSIGLPLSDTRCRIVDLDDPSRDLPADQPGELLISGPQVMSGYFANPSETAQALIKDADGATWLRTGDVARMDSDGYFYILDRKKDMIIRSGLKVYPAKLEKVIAKHLAVADVAVIGRPDPVHTEIVVAVVALKDPESDRDAITGELRALCRQHLAPYEVPMRFEFMQSIPRSVLGKALKKELRRMPPQTEHAATLADDPKATPPSNGNGQTHAETKETA